MDCTADGRYLFTSAFSVEVGGQVSQFSIETKTLLKSFNSENAMLFEFPILALQCTEDSNFCYIIDMCGNSKEIDVKNQSISIPPILNKLMGGNTDNYISS